MIQKNRTTAVFGVLVMLLVGNGCKGCSSASGPDSDLGVARTGTETGREIADIRRVLQEFGNALKTGDVDAAVSIAGIGPKSSDVTASLREELKSLVTNSGAAYDYDIAYVRLLVGTRRLFEGRLVTYHSRTPALWDFEIVATPKGLVVSGIDYTTKNVFKRVDNRFSGASEGQ